MDGRWNAGHGKAGDSVRNGARGHRFFSCILARRTSRHARETLCVPRARPGAPPVPMAGSQRRGGSAWCRIRTHSARPGCPAASDRCRRTPASAGCKAVAAEGEGKGMDIAETLERVLDGDACGGRSGPGDGAYAPSRTWRESPARRAASSVAARFSRAGRGFPPALRASAAVRGRARMPPSVSQKVSQGGMARPRHRPRPLRLRGSYSASASAVSAAPVSPSIRFMLSRIFSR